MTLTQHLDADAVADGPKKSSTVYSSAKCTQNFPREVSLWPLHFSMQIASIFPRLYISATFCDRGKKGTFRNKENSAHLLTLMKIKGFHNNENQDFSTLTLP